MEDVPDTCSPLVKDDSMMMDKTSSVVIPSMKVETEMADDHAEKEKCEGDAEQDASEETDANKPKRKLRKRGRKMRFKRTKKERASRQKCPSDTETTTNFAFMRKRRQDLTLGSKVKVLEMLEHVPKVPQGKIAAMFRVSQSQVSRIMKNKDAIMNQWNRFATPERKRCRMGKAGALEQKLLDWYKEAKSEGLPISGPVLMGKAVSIGTEMGIEFKPSAGWLGRWKDRNGVTLKVFKEKDGTPSIMKIANHWRRYMFAKATRDVPWENVWVVDETVLSFNSVPESMSPMIPGGRDHVCVILACNLSGTERKTPAVVGSVQSLEYMSLPVSYYYQVKGNISLDCFSSWLREWDHELHLKKKKIVLILNRAKHHPENIHLFNISITYFPCETAKILHPLQLGIMASFRSLYRHQQLKFLLSRTHALEHMIHGNACSQNVTMSTSHSQGVTALDAVYMIYKAWKHVSPETIAKGAVRAGLSKDIDALNADDSVVAPPGISQQDFNTFVMKDADLSVEEQEGMEIQDPNPRTCSDSYNGYTNVNSTHVHQNQRNNQQIEAGTQCLSALPKVPDAVIACQVLRRYLQQQRGRLYDEFCKLESAIQLDMISEAQPELKKEEIVDPLHDPSSVHSLHAHKKAESLRAGYLEKLHNALEQKSLQKELKKASQVPLSSGPADGNTATPPQEVRNDLTSQAVNIQRHVQGQELPRQEMSSQEIQPTFQRPNVLHQDMMRPEYHQDMSADRSRANLFEMRPVNMSFYRPPQPNGRNCPSENKNGLLPTVPADLRTVPVSDHRGNMTTHHHPVHVPEVPQNVRQPDARIDHPGISYYTIHNPLHPCVCSNSEYVDSSV